MEPGAKEVPPHGHHTMLSSPFEEDGHPHHEVAEHKAEATRAADPIGSIALPPSRLHPAWIFIHLVSSVRGFLIPLIFVFFSGSRGDLPFIGIAGGMALIGLATTAASWWVFRYEVAGGELRVHSGLISRQERSVPLERIQSIDIGESLMQRLFGVVRVKIETAASGSKGSDVTLEAMDRRTATELAAVLRDAGQSGSREGLGRQPAIDIGDVGTLVKRLSVPGLLLAGATSGRFGPALALVGVFSQFADDIIPGRIWSWLSQSAMHLSTRGIVLGLIGIGLIAWLLAIGSTVLTFGNFTLRRDGDHLLISAGLLNRRQGTIPLARIQAVTISEGILRQPFGLATVRFESAGYGGNAPESGVLFPLIRVSEIAGLLAATVPEMATARADETMRWHHPPTRARRRYALAQVWRLVPFTVAAVALSVPLPFPWWWGLGVLILLPVMASFGVMQYQDSGWAVDEDRRLILRGRTIARWTAIMPRRRIQRRSVERNPFQRRAALGTFRASVASGGVGGTFAIRHLDDDDADTLLNILGARALESA